MNTNYMFQADSIRFDFFFIVIHLLFAFYSLYFNCSENLYRLLSVSFIMFVFTQSVSSSANQMKQTLKQYKKFRRKTNCDLCILYVLCYICWRDKHIHKQRGTYSYVHKNKYIHWRQRERTRKNAKQIPTHFLKQFESLLLITQCIKASKIKVKY